MSFLLKSSGSPFFKHSILASLIFEAIFDKNDLEADVEASMVTFGPNGNDRAFTSLETNKMFAYDQKR